jgi:hypothetical protein
MFSKFLDLGDFGLFGIRLTGDIGGEFSDVGDLDLVGMFIVLFSVLVVFTL